MDPLDADQLRNEFRRMITETQDVHPGYLGPGIWIRVKHRFRTRRTEWMLAIITALWGTVILLPGNNFDLPDFAGFNAIFVNHWILGTGMVTLGLLRIGGLIVNGARKNVTPHIRMVSAACGCLIFFGICYCYWLSGIMNDWLAIYPTFAVFELANAYSAAHDVGESRGRAP